MKQKTEAQQGSIEQLIYEETERRLEIMQSDTYEFPKKMTRVLTMIYPLTQLLM